MDDPQSRWLAIPDDGNLHLIDLKEHSFKGSISRREFGGEAVLTAHFLNDGTLIVSGAAGNLFQVSIG